MPRFSVTNSDGSWDRNIVAASQEIADEVISTGQNASLLGDSGLMVQTAKAEYKKKVSIELLRRQALDRVYTVGLGVDVSVAADRERRSDLMAATFSLSALPYLGAETIPTRAAGGGYVELTMGEAKQLCSQVASHLVELQRSYTILVNSWPPVEDFADAKHWPT